METLNGRFLETLGRNSAEAGVLVLVVALAQWGLGGKIAPRWRCALWLLVMARLLLPVSAGSGVSLFNWTPRVGHHPPVVQPALAGPVVEPASSISRTAPPAMVPEPRPVTESPIPSGPALPPLKSPPVQTASLPAHLSWLSVLFAGWLAGVLFFAGYMLLCIFRLRRRFAKLAPVTDAGLLALLRECRAALGVGGDLGLAECPALATPALYGFWRPRLLLPAGFTGRFFAQEQRFIFLHELAHVRRRDILFNWLATLLQIPHWFNPLIWYGFARWRADRELACDALALEAAGAGHNQEYGRTILRLVDQFTPQAAVPGLVGILEDKRQLQQRIRMIAGFRPGKKFGLLAAALFAVIGAVCLTDAQLPKPAAGANPKPATNNAAGSSYVGTVVDSQGRPVAGVTVACYRYQDYNTGGGYWDREPELLQTTQTDGQGRFSIPASLDITFAVVKVAGLAPAWKTWSSKFDDSPDPLVLSAPAALTGTVVDEQDQPVAGAEVWVAYAISGSEYDSAAGNSTLLGQPARECFSARTGVDGRFRIEDFPANGVAVMAVSKPGLTRWQMGSETPGMWECRPGDDFKLRVGPAGTVEGKVIVAETGQPLGGVKVYVEPNGRGLYGPEFREPIQSRADGGFRDLEVPPGKYSVHAFMPGRLRSEWVVVPGNQEGIVAAGETAGNVVIHASHGAVVEVSVVITNTLLPLANAAVSSGPSAACTDANGMARFRVPAGTNQFVARLDWSPQNCTAEVVAGRTNQVRIELIPPPHLTGTVRDSAGVPAAGVRVSFHPAATYMPLDYTESTTDKNGRYELVLRRSRDTFTVGYFNHTNFVLARSLERNLAAIAGFVELPSNLDLTLQPGITISGSVKDTESLPVTNTLVDLWVEPWHLKGTVGPLATKVDAQGAFSIPALPQGRRYDLSGGVTAKGYGTVMPVVFEKDTKTNDFKFPPFVLQRADRQLRGQILDGNGRPVAGATVFFHGTGQPELRPVKSDLQGNFGFDGVCAGEVTLSVGLSNNTINVSAHGGDTNVVVRLGIKQSGF
jgi:beta-lactamase regulating signal transducer with metallopeptidase domain/protocatechuate 3,4-dioxygenase beta subunit